MPSQVATLFRARSRAFRNAAALRVGAFRPGVVGLILLAVCVVVLLGHAAAPSLLEIPRALSTPDLGGRSPVVGDSALEAAFWLDALLTAFFSFRVMESLFRSEKVRAIELLPVRPSAIFAERLLNAFAEGTLLGLGVGAFFVPLAWHGAPLLAALCVVMGIAASLCTAAATIGANAWLGVQYGGSSGLGDAYGGHGGAFIYAPAVSFALSITALFLLQLGVREVLHDGQITNAFWLATGIAVSLSFGTLLVGARQFITAYHLVAAFFREADEVGFRAVMDYQSSSWSAVRFEGWLAPPARFIFRRHVFQFRRRFPIARSIVGIGAVVAAIGAIFASPEAFPSWAIALAPAVLLTVLERPFGRLDDPALGDQGDDLMPVARRSREVARAAWTVFEIGRVAVPFAVVVAVGRGISAGPIEGGLVGLGSAACALAVAGVVAFARRVGVRAPGTSTAISLSVLALLGGALVLQLWIGAAVAAALCVVGLASISTWPAEPTAGERHE